MNIGTWLLTDSQGNIRDNRQALDFGATGLNEVLQNVMVILTTRVGSVMLDRRFGLAQNYVDAPMNVAEMMIIQQVCVGLAFFEPRAKYKSIQFAPNIGNPGVMNVQLLVTINTVELPPSS